MESLKTEKQVVPSSGLVMLLLGLLLILVSCTAFVIAVKAATDASLILEPAPVWTTATIVLSIIVFILSIFIFIGLFTLQPNQSAVLILFGEYKGTVKKDGFFFVNPFMSRKKISLRSRNLNGEKLKVNDKSGNPIEIAAVVVWKVSDTYKSSFDVDDYKKYVEIHSESCIRHITGKFPYDLEGSDGISLRGSSEEVSNELKDELQEKLEKAGIIVEEARISHLAYAPEIASVMLKRQQADAIIAARAKIVDGAVGMVDMAIKKLSDNNVVELDDERKAAMVSNLMVVLCGEKEAQPVVNSGSIY